MHLGGVSSPTRKSPFDVDVRYNKTEWDQKEPYLKAFNRISSPARSPNKYEHNYNQREDFSPAKIQNQREGPRTFKVKQVIEGGKIHLKDDQFCQFCDDYMHPECYDRALNPSKQPFVNKCKFWLFLRSPLKRFSNKLNF